MVPAKANCICSRKLKMTRSEIACLNLKYLIAIVPCYVVIKGYSALRFASMLDLRGQSLDRPGRRGTCVN